MNAPKADLARVWADAIPLYEFVSERAEREPRKSTGPADVAASADESASQDPTLRTLRNVALAFEHTAQRSAAFEKAQKATLNDLIAGRIVCLGREAKSYQFERVDASVWIGAEVKWYENALTRDGRELIEIRVTTAQLNDQPPAQPQHRPGRPSKRDVVCAAIASYAERDPSLSKPRHERHRAYRAYISSNGFDPRKDDGFSEKTFEKYESEFRRQTK